LRRKMNRRKRYVRDVDIVRADGGDSAELSGGGGGDGEEEEDEEHRGATFLEKGLGGGGGGKTGRDLGRGESDGVARVGGIVAEDDLWRGVESAMERSKKERDERRKVPW
jgi:hypothetical protein